MLGRWNILPIKMIVFGGKLPNHFETFTFAQISRNKIVFNQIAWPIFILFSCFVFSYGSTHPTLMDWLGTTLFKRIAMQLNYE